MFIFIILTQNIEYFQKALSIAKFVQKRNIQNSEKRMFYDFGVLSDRSMMGLSYLRRNRFGNKFITGSRHVNIEKCMISPCVF